MTKKYNNIKNYCWKPFICTHTCSQNPPLSPPQPSLHVPCQSVMTSSCQWVCFSWGEASVNSAKARHLWIMSKIHFSSSYSYYFRFCARNTWRFSSAIISPGVCCLSFWHFLFLCEERSRLLSRAHSSIHCALSHFQLQDRTALLSLELHNCSPIFALTH